LNCSLTLVCPYIVKIGIKKLFRVFKSFFQNCLIFNNTKLLYNIFCLHIMKKGKKELFTRFSVTFVLQNQSQFLHLDLDSYSKFRSISIGSNSANGDRSETVVLATHCEGVLPSFLVSWISLCQECFTGIRHAATVPFYRVRNKSVKGIT